MTKPNPLRAIEPSPEQNLRASFRREDEALRTVAEERVYQKAQRRLYAEKHSLIGFPPISKLREILGG